MVGVVIDEEAVNLAYHFPHSIWIVVFKLDFLLLALLRPQSASKSWATRFLHTANRLPRPHKALKYALREHSTDLCTGIFRPSLSSMVKSDQFGFSNHLCSISTSMPVSRCGGALLLTA
jgi:hypothetical protein